MEIEYLLNSEERNKIIVEDKANKLEFIERLNSSIENPNSIPDNKANEIEANKIKKNTEHHLYKNNQGSKTNIIPTKRSLIDQESIQKHYYKSKTARLRESK